MPVSPDTPPNEIAVGPQMVLSEAIKPTESKEEPIEQQEPEPLPETVKPVVEDPKPEMKPEIDIRRSPKLKMRSVVLSPSVPPPPLQGEAQGGSQTQAGQSEEIRTQEKLEKRARGRMRRRPPPRNRSIPRAPTPTPRQWQAHHPRSRPQPGGARSRRTSIATSVLPQAEVAACPRSPSPSIVPGSCALGAACAELWKMRRSIRRRLPWRTAPALFRRHRPMSVKAAMSRLRCRLGLMNDSRAQRCLH